jgi:hypothetical protein
LVYLCVSVDLINFSATVSSALPSISQARLTPTLRCLPMASSLRPGSTELPLLGKSSFAVWLYKPARGAAARHPEQAPGLVEHLSRVTARRARVLDAGEPVLDAAVVAWRVHRRRAPDSCRWPSVPRSSPGAAQKCGRTSRARRPPTAPALPRSDRWEAAAIVRRAIEDDSARCAPQWRPGGPLQARSDSDPAAL